jgi:hypothetical protein
MMIDGMICLSGHKDKSLSIRMSSMVVIKVAAVFAATQLFYQLIIIITIIANRPSSSSRQAEQSHLP